MRVHAISAVALAIFCVLSAMATAHPPALHLHLETLQGPDTPTEHFRPLPGTTPPVGMRVGVATAMPGATVSVPLPEGRVVYLAQFKADLNPAIADRLAQIGAELVHVVAPRWAVVAEGSSEAKFWATLAPLCVRTPERLLAEDEDTVKVQSLGLGLDKVSVDKDRKQEIVDRVSVEGYDEYMRHLTGDLAFDLDGRSYTLDTRYTHAEGSDIAARYMYDRLESFGFNILVQNFTVSGTETVNVIAEIRGSVYPDEIVVLGAHFDSISERPSDLAPGAEDNASGAAGILEVARALASANYRPQRTVHLIGWGAEEQGLRGSAHYTTVVDPRQVISGLCLDMIAFETTSQTGLIIEGGFQWVELMNLVEDNFNGYTPLEPLLAYASFGSDHVSLQRAGIPAILGIDEAWDAYPHYHTTRDTYAEIDSRRGAIVMQGMVASLLDLAGVD